MERGVGGVARSYLSSSLVDFSSSSAKVKKNGFHFSLSRFLHLLLFSGRIFPVHLCEINARHISVLFQTDTRRNPTIFHERAGTCHFFMWGRRQSKYDQSLARSFDTRLIGSNLKQKRSLRSSLLGSGRPQVKAAHEK